MPTEIALSPEEQAFAEISAKLTAAHVAVDEARGAFNLFRYRNPISTPEVIARAAELRGTVEQAERSLQALLAPYSEAKARINGWR